MNVISFIYTMLVNVGILKVQVMIYINNLIRIQQKNYYNTIFNQTNTILGFCKRVPNETI